MLRIYPLLRSELDQLILQSHVIEKDGHGIKVVRLQDGRFLKYFRRKRFLTAN